MSASKQLSALTVHDDAESSSYDEADFELDLAMALRESLEFESTIQKRVGFLHQSLAASQSRCAQCRRCRYANRSHKRPLESDASTFEWPSAEELALLAKAAVDDVLVHDDDDDDDEDDDEEAEQVQDDDDNKQTDDGKEKQTNLEEKEKDDRVETGVESPIEEKQVSKEREEGGGSSFHFYVKFLYFLNVMFTPSSPPCH